MPVLQSLLTSQMTIMNMMSADTVEKKKRPIFAVFILLSILLFLTIAGCSSNTKTEYNTKGKTIASAETDFGTNEFQNSTCILTTCDVPDGTATTAQVIQVPETINNRTVIGIDEGAFTNIAAEAVILPDTITYISNRCFQNCSNLKYVDFGENVQTIGEAIFVNCNSMESITIPEGVTTISTLFEGSSEMLQEVHLPRSLIEMREPVFDPEAFPNASVYGYTGYFAEEAAEHYGLPFVGTQYIQPWP